MKMLCEGDINVDVITKNGDVTNGTQRVKVIPGCRTLGLTALNSLLQYVNWLVWEVCSVN